MHWHPLSRASIDGLFAAAPPAHTALPLGVIASRQSCMLSTPLPSTRATKTRSRRQAVTAPLHSGTRPRSSASRNTNTQQHSTWRVYVFLCSLVPSGASGCYSSSRLVGTATLTHTCRHTSAATWPSQQPSGTQRATCLATVSATTGVR